MTSIVGSRTLLRQSGRILSRRLIPLQNKSIAQPQSTQRARNYTTQRTRNYATIVPTRSPVKRLDPRTVIEEETLPGYKAENYYPVYIGQVFQDRYQTVGKLGYGVSSTVWLCRDLNNPNEYVALKVYVRQSKHHRELPIYEHINSLSSNHHGRNHVRKFYESFEVQGPYGTHVCLVHQPLGTSLGEIAENTQDGTLSADFLREITRWILRGVEFLHEEAHVIHTDIKAHNILFGAANGSVFADFERSEAADPSPRKETGNRTIYRSRQMKYTPGLPALTDLSEARSGKVRNTDAIMPDIYRAPEVILGMPWSYPVDVWSLGMVIWDLFEGKRLFPSRNEKNRYSVNHHLAKMVAIMGPPPKDFLARSQHSRLFWDERGNWEGIVPVPDVDLDTSEHRLQGEDKKKFLTFIRKMLQWRPEDRATCHDLFTDEWLMEDLTAARRLPSLGTPATPESSYSSDMLALLDHTPSFQPTDAA